MTYYEDLSISNSSLSVFNYDPSYFYKVFITKEITDKKESESMLLGSIIHCLILEPEEFDKRYFISSVTPEEMPSGMMLEYVKTLSTFPIVDEIAHEAAYLKSGYKITRDKVLENFNKGTSFKKYLEELKDSRQMVSQFMYDSAKLHVENVVNSSYWNVILGSHKWEESKELEIYWSLDPIKVEGCDIILPLKSKLDHLYFRKEGNKLYIKYFDYKTDSQKPIHRYVESFEYWKTYRQLAFYTLAIKAWVTQQYPDLELDISMYIVPIDVVRAKTIIYEIDSSYIQRGMEELTNNFNDLAWHMCTNNWDLPRSLYEVDVPKLEFVSL